jgi:hypothetical protein
MKKLQKNFRNEKYLVVYIDLSSSNAYQTDEFTRESVIELIYDQIIEECRKYGISTIDKKIEKYSLLPNLFDI